MLPALNRAEYVITVLYVSSHQDFVDIRPRLNSCERD